MTKKTQPLPQAVIDAATSTDAATRSTAFAEAGASFVTAWNDAEGVVSEAQASKLARVLEAAKAFPAMVTGTIWKDTVRVPVERGVRLALSARYGEDYLLTERGKRNLSSQVSQIKAVLHAITDPKGLRPKTGEAFDVFLSRVREAGNGGTTRGGNTTRGADRKGGKETAKADPKKAAQAVDAALALLTRGDAKFAADLSACLNDNGTRERLAGWCARNAEVLNAD